MLTKKQTQDREEMVEIVQRISVVLSDKTEILRDLVHDGHYEDAHDMISNLAEGLSLMHPGLDSLICVERAERLSKN